MTSHRNPTLSKARFAAGRQCLKRLYLESYHRELADPVSEAAQARFDVGNAVGELARWRFPGGRLIEETYLQHDRAVAATQRLLAGSPVPPLYESAFTFEGIRIRADIIPENVSGAFQLVEVKSTTGVRETHMPDVAIQLYALEGAGLSPERAYLMHLNNQYVYQGGEYDLEQLFTLSDVTDQARQFAADIVPGELARMWETLQGDVPPEIEVGPHCDQPYRCPFYGYCHPGEPEAPDTDPTLARVGESLGQELAVIEPPVSFLDFETFMPALPRYVGTRPYQTIPFQWSLHIQQAGGGLTHRHFLNEDAADPRERLITSLLPAVPASGSIMTYSSYEKRILSELAEAFPQYQAPLHSLRDRLFDLYPVTRRNYRHPALSSYSLKAVLPFLAGGLGYEDLGIQEGTEASIAYLRLIDGDASETERAQLRADLLAYCARDTEALVEVLAALRRASGI